MNIKKLVNRLRERPKNTEEHLDALKTEWKAAVEKLFRQIEVWLKPAIDEGLLKSHRSRKDINEPDFGTYEIPILKITDNRVTVRVEPVTGRAVGIARGSNQNLTGLQGRVDFICGPVSVPLVRTHSERWAALPLRGEPMELTEESFSELLAEAFLDE